MSTLTDPIHVKEANDAPIAPPVAESIEETGLPPAIIEHLILKYLHFNGELPGREIANMIGLQFSVIQCCPN